MIFKPFIKSNARNTNFFTKKKKKVTNGWGGEWLSVNEKVILVVDLDEN